MQEQSNDKLIFVKSSSVGEDSKGRTKLDLRFSEEETSQLREELSKISSRAKLQIHYTETGAFLFVKEVQAPGSMLNKAATSTGKNVKDKIEALRKANA